MKRRIAEVLGGLSIGSILLALPSCILPKPRRNALRGLGDIQQKRSQSDQGTPQLDDIPTRSLLRIFHICGGTALSWRMREPSLQLILPVLQPKQCVSFYHSSIAFPSCLATICKLPRCWVRNYVSAVFSHCLKVWESTQAVRLFHSRLKWV